MIHFACQSDPGRQHQTNEDRWYADPGRGIFLVADGMANDIAPQFVVDHLPPRLAELAEGKVDLADAHFHGQLQTLLQELNVQIYGEMADHGERGLGTTLVLVFLRKPQALIAHIGDSRVYRYRAGKLEPLTRDHSLMQQLVDQGRIREEEGRASRGNGGPTRFLGKSEVVEADLRLLELLPGDQFLMCSDGLTEMLRDEEIRAVFQKQLGPEDTCEHLVNAANYAGGRDNVTALVAAVGEEGGEVETEAG